VNYTDHVIRDVLLNGISDLDIRREVLGTADILGKPINDVIAVVESKEMARNALPSSAVSAISSFRRQQSTTSSFAPPNDMPFRLPTSTAPPQADRVKQAACPDCRKQFNLFSKGANGWNAKPHEFCRECWKLRRRRKPAQAGQQGATAAIQAETFGPISQIAAVTATIDKTLRRRRRDRLYCAHPSRPSHLFRRGVETRTPS
jgi:hypothetical protein